MDRLAARLESRSLVKFILGLTNFDLPEIRFLTQVYTLAGADIIDVAAEPAIVATARQAMADIGRQLPSLKDRPAIMVSTALAHDPHIEGVAIPAAYRPAVAPANTAELTAGVEACLEQGAEMVELHASDSDDGALEAAVEAVHPLLGARYLSVCLGTQGRRSPRQVLRQAKIAEEVHGRHTMIQAEGLTATRRADPFSSLPGLALAQALLAYTSAYVLVAGGANLWTRNLAETLGVGVHGVASGTYARDLVRRFQAAEPQDVQWEPLARVAGAFVAQLRGSSGGHV